MSRSTYIAFKRELSAGIYPLLISDISVIKSGENPQVIVSFENNGNTHQEMYWIGSTNYTKLQKIILQAGLNPSEQVKKKDIVGKSVLGLITELKTMRGAEEIKSEKRLSETAEIGTEPKFKTELITYKQDGF